MDGIVYKAYNLSTKEKVAIKVIQKAGVDSEEMDNLHTEISILSELDHPNIVKLYEAFETDEKLFLVMELMQGGELFDRIVENECFTEDEAKQVMMPIIDAVEYCHSHDIIHRDLKPENLLYETTDEFSLVKITDFGVARFMPKSCFATTACGTPGYTAPEIIMGKGYGKEVDVWSIGIIMYILL
jgi:calcium/calmodulin-dependent protein kinase I